MQSGEVLVTSLVWRTFFDCLPFVDSIVCVTCGLCVNLYASNRRCILRNFWTALAAILLFLIKHISRNKSVIGAGFWHGPYTSASWHLYSSPTLAYPHEWRWPLHPPTYPPETYSTGLGRWFESSTGERSNHCSPLVIPPHTLSLILSLLLRI